GAWRRSRRERALELRHWPVEGIAQHHAWPTALRPVRTQRRGTPPLSARQERSRGPEGARRCFSSFDLAARHRGRSLSSRQKGGSEELRSGSSRRIATPRNRPLIATKERQRASRRPPLARTTGEWRR